MGDEVVDINFALHVPVDDLGHVTPALRTAKSGPLPHAARHQLERSGRDFLARGGNANNHAGAPASVAAFQRLAHHLDVADTFKGKISPTLGEVNEILDEVSCDLLGIDKMGRAKLARDCLPLRIEVNPNNQVRAGHAGALDHVQADSSQSEDDDVVAGLNLGGVDHRADARGDATADIADLVKWGVFAHLCYANLGEHRVVGKGGCAHVVVEHLVVKRKPACPVRHHAA